MSEALIGISILAKPPFELSPGWTKSELSDGEALVSLTEALALIERVWPQALEFLLRNVRGVFPLLPGPSGSLHSASLSDRRGLVIVSFHRGRPQDLAESLLHEARHQEFYVRFEGVDAWDEAGVMLRHPWKPSERPVKAVFLAWHAFLAVGEFYARLALHSANAPRRYADFAARAHDTRDQCAVCSDALRAIRKSLYAPGLALLDELDDGLDRLTQLLREFPAHVAR